MRVVWSILICVWVAVTAFSFTNETTDKETKKKISAGKKLFAQHCASCHGPKSVHAAEMRKEIEKHGAEYILKFIANPATYGNQRMPAFQGVLKDHEFESLMLYLKSL